MNGLLECWKKYFINLDVASIIQETSVKFPGGDARHYLFGGGCEEGLQQMNLITNERQR